jgi:hypothetical protein
MLLAGLLVFGAIGLFLRALPDPGIGSRTAIAPPNAPEVARADKANDRGHEILEWAVSTVARAFEDDDAVDTQVRLSLVTDPATARSIAEQHGADLRTFGFETPGTPLHDIELTGFTQNQRTGEIWGEVAWNTLALNPGAAHDHEVGGAFRARVALRRGPAQWRVTSFELLAPE